MSRFQIARNFKGQLHLLLLVTVLAFLLIPTTNLYAGEKGKISYRAYTGFMPLVSGDANTGSTTSVVGSGTFEGFTFTGTATITVPTQSYSDVYIGGVPLILEYAYRYNPEWTARAGIGVQYFPAKTFDAVNVSAAGTVTAPDGSTLTGTAAFTVEGELDDMYRIPIFIGGSYHFLHNEGSNLDPYIRGDVGLIVQPAVDVTVRLAGVSAEEKFWDTSALALVDLGIGVEGKVGSYGMFGEVRVQYTSAPSNADALGNIADAEGIIAIPILVGIRF